MPSTYEPIATTTLGSAQATITFSSIPATYTDLRLILVATGSSAGSQVKMQFNSDTATNYSQTYVYGDGATAASTRDTTKAFNWIDVVGLSTTIPHHYDINIFSYTGSTNKTCLTATQEDNNGSGYVTRFVNLWRNTAAITRIDLTSTTGNLAIGTTATLFGILKA